MARSQNNTAQEPRSNNALATIDPPRLPMPKDGYELAEGKVLDAGMWKVLVEATYPTARSSQAVIMALDYCKARGLDPFKKPVHIVPMWNSQLRKEVETVWPGINEVQTTAARTGEWAGMDKPEWGPDIEKTFKGKVKEWVDGRQVQVDEEVTLTFPEWCEVTVYRLIKGHRCAFSEPVYWLEAYARTGGGELPNAMWRKRTRGQLQKVAKAASLRAAFPEEGEYTAEEMHGKEIGEIEGVIIDHAPVKDVDVDTNPLGSQESAVPEKEVVTEDGEIVKEEIREPSVIEVPEDANHQHWANFGKQIIKAVSNSKTPVEAKAWVDANHDIFVRMKEASVLLVKTADGGKNNVMYMRLRTAVDNAFDKLVKSTEMSAEDLQKLKGKTNDANANKPDAAEETENPAP